MSGAARVAWFRFRATFGRRLGGYIAIVILIGLTGGIALGSLAGARRTQSSYPKFLRSTNPSDLTVSAFGSSGDAAAALTKDIARLPAVKHVRTLDVPTFATLSPTGAPAPVSTVFTIASPDGEMSTQDRLSVVHGRMSDPGAADQAVVTASAAQQLRAHVGDVLHLGLFTSHTAPPKLRVDVTVVGIVTFDNQVIEDDIDAAWGFVMLTPALLQRATAAAPGAISPTLYALQLEHGAADVARVERELVTKIPPGAQYEFHATAPVVAQDEDAIRPESIALGAFGAIAFLVTMVIAAQAVARQLRAGDDERNILRALGADPTMATADALLGVLGAIVLGSLLTVIVALALSPLAPLGPVRVVYPGSGIALDWTVLGFGGAGFVLVLGAVALVIAFRRAPHRVARRAELAARQSRAARTATNVGLPIAAATGARFALERGSGKGAVPMRSALSGTVLAVAMVVATLTFASGLHTLISHPALYGWNWNYEINPSNEVPPQTRTLLTHDPDVESWMGASEVIVDVDGQQLPALLALPPLTISPPILAGHNLDATNQIVIGSASLARLHKHVGDTVTMSYGKPADAPAYVPPISLRIVGSATLPAVGFNSFVADHTSMGTGALVSADIEPLKFRKAQLNPDPILNGPDMVFVRMRPGLSAAAGRADLQRIVNETDRDFNADPNAIGNNITIVGVQRPAQIVNYRSVGDAPVLLAAGLAAGAVLGLSLTLVASVRRRRRELALLKTLGFTRRQLAAVVAWQSTIAALVGIAVGVPIGIVGGRILWELFARAINAVPQPTVPTGAIVLVAIGALVLANLVAAIPGFQAARTRTAILLRAE